MYIGEHLLMNKNSNHKKQEQAFAANLMQNLVVPAFVLDPDCKVLVWNRACERLTGVPASEVVGTNDHWQAFYSERRLCLADVIAKGRSEDLSTLYLYHAEPSEHGFGFKAENWCVMPRLGTRLYLAIDAGPIYAEDGQLIAVVETLRDMTEPKLAEQGLMDAKAAAENALQKLDESTQSLRVLSRAIEQSPVMNVITDVNGVIEYVNPKFHEITGYASEEAIGKTTSILNADVHTKEFFTELWKTISSGREWHGEMCNRKKNGAIYWEYVSISPVRNDKGEITQYIASKEDITERKLVEKEKDEMRRNQQALLNAIQETTFLMEKDGTILVINEIGARRLKTRPEEMAGKKIFDYFPPKAVEARRLKFNEIALSGKPEIFEDERAERHYYNAIYPIFDEQGEVTRFAVYAADITQQHRQKLIDDTLSAINQQILQRVPPQKVLTAICQELAAAFHLEVAWLGRKEPNGSVTVLAAEGSATKYIEHLRIDSVRWDDTPQGQGPGASAIRSGQTQAFRVDDPRFQVWSRIALDNNLQSTLAIPLVIRNEMYGVFALYSSNPVLFDAPELVDQLNSVSKRICIALESAMDQQQVRLLSLALESAGNGILITDPQGKIQWANPAFSKLCGYSREELLGQNPRILKSGRQSSDFYRLLWETISKGKNWSSETVERAKDGTFYTVSQTITPIIDNGELTHFIAIHEDITVQKLTQERIAHMAHYDVLTGLPNRSLFTDRLELSLATAKRSKTRLGLMFIDLDKFKPVNDEFGHDVGDLLLKEAAKRMQHCVRESDTVSRIGGDEFVVLLPAVETEQDAMLVAEKILHALNQPFELAGHCISISASIGVAAYPEHGSDERTLTKNADVAMYYAKSAGRNNAMLYRFGLGSSL
jgi:diguanylate cyclase (GGDEF)-like protein/PAS domain S-box-containing protein